jgi:V8-like Glu-specific endopeptidase
LGLSKYLLCIAAAGVAVALGAIAAPKPSPAAASVPAARTYAGTPTVGVLFVSATTVYHSCTASVVHSRRGNVLLTAAHCIDGTGTGYVFAPGFHGGVSPYGRWRVTAAYVDSTWLAKQDPAHDYAFLTVAPRRVRGQSEQIEQVTGANRLGSRAIRGERVTVPGYPAGTDNDPITCTTPLYFSGFYPAFDCNPYVGGTSGAPFLVHTARGSVVVGLIGGLHQGGCTSSTSYSSPLGAAAQQVYHRAAAGVRGDDADPAGSDGC